MKSYKNAFMNMYKFAEMNTLQKWWWDAKKSHQKLGYNGSTLCFKVHLCSRGWIVEDAHVPSINCGSCCGFCQWW